jgi:hypothetical protein
MDMTEILFRGVRFYRDVEATGDVKIALITTLYPVFWELPRKKMKVREGFGIVC